MSRIGFSSTEMRCHSERGEAQQSEVEESRGNSLRFRRKTPRLLPRSRDALGMTKITFSLSPLEFFLSQPGQTQQQLRPLLFSR